MKKLTKTCAVTLVIGLMVTAFSGCGGTKIPDTENTLIIKAYEGGYGITFLTELGNKFEEIYPGTTVYVSGSTTLTNPEMEMDLKANAKYNPTDLSFGGAINFNKYVAKGKDFLKDTDCVLEDLSDVYNSAPYGETTLIKDKMLPEFYEYYKYANTESRYAMPWAHDANGLVYHADMFQDNGWAVPQTTNDLVGLIPQIKSAGFVPFTYPGSIGYWSYTTQIWWAQYEGLSSFEKFWRAKDTEGNYSTIQYAQTGRLETMKVLESLIGETSNSFPGSIGVNHTIAQTDFLDKDINKIAMMPNGGWLENEVKKNFPIGSVKIKMMKTPIVSSIVNKLETVKTEEKLKALITAIDNGEKSLSGVSEADFNRVVEARRMTYSPGYDHIALIPSYANAKVLAKDFLRLMYSDMGLQIYHEQTRSALPMKSNILEKEENVKNFTDFQKSLIDINKNAISIAGSYYYDPLFYLGNMQTYYIYAPEKFIGGIGEDRLTAKEFMTADYNYIVERFEKHKIDAGIKN